MGKYTYIHVNSITLKPWQEGLLLWPLCFRKSHSGLYYCLSHGLGSMESQRDDTELASLSRPCTGPGILCTVLFPEFIPWTVSLVCTHLNPKDGLLVIVGKDNRCSLGRTGVSTCAHVKLLKGERKLEEGVG